MRVLSGIQPSGDFLHVGNYFGALRQQVALQEQHEVLLFIADYHSMTSVREGAKRRAYTRASEEPSTTRTPVAPRGANQKRTPSVAIAAGLAGAAQRSTTRPSSGSMRAKK